MISEQYKKFLTDLHSKNRFTEKNYWYLDFKNFISNESLPTSLIDFGCSHGALIQKIKQDFPKIQTVDGYDPGVIEFQNKPNRKYDMLVSTDVIEHIEPEFLDETLRYIDSLYTKTAWIIIACYPAKKSLPDGRNAHLIIEPPSWWIEKIQSVIPSSKITDQQILIQNPDSDTIDRKTNKVIVPKGQKIELRLTLRK